MSKPLNTRTQGRTLILSIDSDQISDEKEFNQFRDSLRETAQNTDATGFVVNLAKLRLLPSELLAVFVELHRHAPNRVKLCNLHSTILDTLTRTQLIRLFDVFDSESDAVASLVETSIEV